MVWLFCEIIGLLKDNPIIVPIIVIIIMDFIFTRKIYKFCIARSFGLLLFVFGICFIALVRLFQHYLLPIIREIYTLIYNQIYYVNIFDDGFRNASLSIGGSITLSIAVLGVILTLIRSTLNRQQNNTDVQRLITEQISRAVEQIGAYKYDANSTEYQPNIEARLGGLYSLQRIMQDSPRDLQAITRTFYAYVRENTKRARTDQPKIDSDGNKTYQFPEDIKAAVNIIGQFSKEIFLDSQLNFSLANFTEYHLVGIDFSDTNLENVDLSGTNFTNANLSRANLSLAVLAGTILFRTNLSGANLSDTNLRETILDGVILNGANLSRVDLRGKTFHNAKLSGANLFKTQLPNADLFEADLTNAILFEANLFRTNLRDADLSGADLSEAFNVEQPQIEQAKGDLLTKIPLKLSTGEPSNLTRPEHWKEPKNQKKITIHHS